MVHSELLLKFLKNRRRNLLNAHEKMSVDTRCFDSVWNFTMLKAFLGGILIKVFYLNANFMEEDKVDSLHKKFVKFRKILKAIWLMSLTNSQWNIWVA